MVSFHIKILPSCSLSSHKTLSNHMQFYTITLFFLTNSNLDYTVFFWMIVSVSPLFADINVNLVHFHHYPLLKCSLLNPFMLEIVPPSLVSPKHSICIWYCPDFPLKAYLAELSLSFWTEPRPCATPFAFFSCPEKVSVENSLLRLIWPQHFHAVNGVESKVGRFLTFLVIF